MRLRGNNNAVSVGCSAAAFAAAGCAIAVWGILAEFEAAALKFVMIAYLFMAVPLFLASLSGGTSRPEHKSFRGTPPAYMEGRHVKRRLRLIASASAFLSFAVLTLTFCGQIWALSRFGYNPDRPWLLWLVFMTGPLAAAFLASTTFKFLSVKCGWMTPDEAREWRGKRWPETWLEPVDKKDGK